MECESICGCVCGQLINTSAGINKPPDPILAIDLYLFLCFPLPFFLSLHNIQTMYIQSILELYVWDILLYSERMWTLGLLWPGCDQGLIGLHHMPPITLTTLGSMPLNSCWLYWTLDLLRWPNLFKDQCNGWVPGSLHSPDERDQSFIHFFVAKHARSEKSICWGDCGLINRPVMCFRQLLSFLLLIAAGCHLCHPAHVPVHLDNKKDQ